MYKGKDCKVCPQQKKCTKQRNGIRYIKSFPYEKERNAMNEKMSTQNGKEIYKLRAITVEPVFGDIKENKGMRSFFTRGMYTVKTEFNLVCAASNLKKIWIESYSKDKSDKRYFPNFLYYFSSC